MFCHGLHTQLVPKNYKLALILFLDPGNLTASGHVEITVRCVEDSKSFTLDADETMHIDESSVKVVGGPRVAHTERKGDDLIGHLAAPLKMGRRYVLSMSFESRMNEVHQRLPNEGRRGLYSIELPSRGWEQFLRLDVHLSYVSVHKAEEKEDLERLPTSSTIMPARPSPASTGLT